MAYPYNVCCVLVLEYEEVYLDSLPNAEYYERSFMHRETVTHVAVAK